MIALLVIRVLIVIFSFPQTSGLEYHEFLLGADANITFIKTINEQSTISWEIFSIDGDKPFCIDGTFMPDALHPSQRDRFQIIENRTKNKLSATLQIRRIEQIDSSIYILSLEEGTQYNRISYILDAYVVVLLPPGKATCEIRRLAFSNTWREVHCSATLSSDGGGFIVCYQQGVKAPFRKPPERSATHLSAVFWMNINFPFLCCSYEVDLEKDESSCTDFTFYPTPRQEEDTPTIDASVDMGATATPFDNGNRITTLTILKNLSTDDNPLSEGKIQIPLSYSTINMVATILGVANLIFVSISVIMLITGCVCFALGMRRNS